MLIYALYTTFRIELNHFSMTASLNVNKNPLRMKQRGQIVKTNNVQGSQKVVTCPNNRPQSDITMYF